MHTYKLPRVVPSIVRAAPLGCDTVRATELGLHPSVCGTLLVCRVNGATAHGVWLHGS